MRAKDVIHKVGTGIHRAIFRATKGRVAGRLIGMPVVELTTIGRKSGQARSTMLTAPILEDGRIVLVASFGGDEKHPAWYLNLQAHKDVRITAAGRTGAWVAHTADPAERATLWPQVTAEFGNYADYQKRTTREIPLVILEPADPTGPAGAAEPTGPAEPEGPAGSA